MKSRLENDLTLFNQEHMIEKTDMTQTGDESTLINYDEKELERFIAPAYPEAFASGCIINGFTP